MCTALRTVSSPPTARDRCRRRAESAPVRRAHKHFPLRRLFHPTQLRRAVCAGPHGSVISSDGFYYTTQRTIAQTWAAGPNHCSGPKRFVNTPWTVPPRPLALSVSVCLCLCLCLGLCLSLSLSLSVSNWPSSPSLPHLVFYLSLCAPAGERFQLQLLGAAR